MTECVAFYPEYPYIYTLYRVLPLPYVNYVFTEAGPFKHVNVRIVNKTLMVFMTSCQILPCTCLTFHRSAVTSASTVCWYQNNWAQVSLQNDYLIRPDIILPSAKFYILCKADNTRSRRDHRVDRTAVYMHNLQYGTRRFVAMFAQFGVPILSLSYTRRI